MPAHFDPSKPSSEQERTQAFRLLFLCLMATGIGNNMLFAILLVHTGDILALTEHGGWRLELQGFYLFGALAIVFLGSGKYAIKPD